MFQTTKFLIILLVIVTIIAMGLFTYGVIDRFLNKKFLKKRSIDPVILNIENARRMIPMGPVGNLKKYIVNNENNLSDKNTGIYPTWHTDSFELGKMCDEVTLGLCFSYKNPNHEDSKLCIDVANNFLQRFYHRLLEIQNTTFSSIPWGTSSSEFYINVTCMAAYYLLLPQPTCPQLAAYIILMLIKSPRSALGIEMNEYNAVYVTGPYLLAKYFLNQKVDKSEVKYVMDYLRFDLVHKSGASGLHKDGTFISEKLVLFSECERLTSHVSNYIYNLLGVSSNLHPMYNKVKNIIAHPEINISIPAIYGRTKDLSFITSKTSQYGLQVIPFSKYLRYFTKNHQFAVKGITNYLAYYSADHTNYKQFQYWTMYRLVHLIQSKKSFSFPDHSILANTNSALDLKPTAEERVRNYFTNKGESFVLKYKEYGVLWQDYTISNIFPDVFIIEHIIINTLTNLIENFISIDNQTNKEIRYYGVSQKCSILDYEQYLNFTIIPGKSKKIFAVTYDLNENTIDFNNNYGKELIFPIKLSDKIQIQRLENFGVLMDNIQPKLAAPITLEHESETINVKINEIDTKFTFNKNENQYLYN